MRIIACDRPAGALGLTPGLALADARARVPALDVVPAEPRADAALLEHITEWCDRYTPLVARDAPDGVILDITGCAHLFGGEQAMLADLLAGLARSGLTVRGAVADASDAARALARYGAGGVVAPGKTAKAVHPLPVAALGLSPDETQTLTRLGLAVIGDLAERPRSALAARFGARMTARLDRLLGLAQAPVSPRRPVPEDVAERRLAEPVARDDDIARTLDALAGRLAGMLERKGRGGRRFEASFFRTDGAVRRIAVASSRPLQDGAAVARLFGERLDGLADPLDPGFGFDLIRLAALHSEPLRPAQASLDGKAAEEAEVAGLVDRLSARFGAESVLRLGICDSHIPEAAGRAVPAVMDGAASAPCGRPDAAGPPARPLSLFDPPQPIETLAEVPDGPPLRFRWRRVLHEVARAEGPERIAPEWWRRGDDSLTRDYYRVEDVQGRRFWVYREGLYGRETNAPRWFLHGLFA